MALNMLRGPVQGTYNGKEMKQTMKALQSASTARGGWIIGLALAGITALVAAGGATGEAASMSYHNPVFSRNFPDPMVLRINAHNYYAYGTTVLWQKGLFPILHSTDLVHWKPAGSIFQKGPSWSEGEYWAPDVVKHGKTYYAYYTGSYNGLHCIGVTLAPSPTGPFKGGRRISCSEKNGTGFIDPDLFIDQDGKAYLYVSVDNPEHHITVIPMKPDLQHPAGAPKDILTVNQAWEHGKNRATVEGPFVILRNGTYYLFFSGNDWEDTYATGYATATSPMGPFTPSSGNPVVQGDAKVHGPGGGSVVQGPDGNLWLVYHGRSQAVDPTGLSRNLRIDPITWNGSVPSVHVTP
jgi:beta-xylosidase